jgi:hypothetical protein
MNYWKRWEIWHWRLVTELLELQCFLNLEAVRRARFTGSGVLKAVIHIHIHI